MKKYNNSHFSFFSSSKSLKNEKKTIKSAFPQLFACFGVYRNKIKYSYSYKKKIYLKFFPGKTKTTTTTITTTKISNKRKEKLAKKII